MSRLTPTRAQLEITFQQSTGGKKQSDLAEFSVRTSPSRYIEPTKCLQAARIIAKRSSISHIVRNRTVTSTAGKEILLVDDDEALRLSLGEQLRLYADVATVETESGAEALSLAKIRHFDAVLLNVDLPDMDGREVCRIMRRNGFKPPVIILTAAASDADIILGLEAGANDYVTKPFRLGILLARLRAQLRQHEQSEEAILTIGPYAFRPSAKLLIHSETGKKLRLTGKETSTLRHLYRNASNVVSREILLSEVWGYNARVTTHTLETHIYRLRKKIESNPSKPKILVTRPGGYQLMR